jgi:hypothetical protein
MKVSSAKRSGLALALVIVAGAAMAAAWSVADTRTLALVRIKEGLRTRETAREEMSRQRLALAYALALLESGIPPQKAGQPYQCQCTVLTRNANPQAYVVTFQRLGPTTWNVQARAKTDSDPSVLPEPTRFAPSGP